MAGKKAAKRAWIVGIDEVGRGPLAGPVTVCAVAVPYAEYRAFVRRARALGITDSKKITPESRCTLSHSIDAMCKQQRVRIAIASAGASRIDADGIAVCIKKLVARTLRQLAIPPDCTEVLLDGSLFAPATFRHQKTFIRGDSLHEVIGAASIVAKVHRDEYMDRQAKRYPAYGFLDHKGYGTKRHLNALAQHGLCPLHRRSFCRRFL
ncbi:MAG: hypothetical protein RL150_27 [Candidatus Parcubacteria bacterium]|jgi:ribonuclease HII